jgi:hypothetical protein
MTTQERSVARRLSGPFVFCLLLTSISATGFLIGVLLSQWGARLHPPIGWDRWYVNAGGKANARKEIVLDQPSALRAVGRSNSDQIWNVSMGKPLADLKKSARYQLHCRLRSRYQSPILLSITDAQPPHLPRGLMRYFSPTSQWQDYDFEFVTTASELPATLAFYLAASKFEVDIDDFRLSEQSSKSGDVLVFHPSGWSMVPVIPGGKLTYPVSDSQPVRFERRANNSAPILEYYLSGIPNKEGLMLEIQLSATPDQEVDLRIESATNPRELRHFIARIPLTADAKTTIFPVEWAKQTEEQYLVIDAKQPIADIAIHSARWRLPEPAPPVP